jgi:hypothetical protein
MTVVALISGQIIGAPELRPTADGRTITIATVKARAGKNTIELWQIQAHQQETGFALVRLNAGDFVSFQGIPSSRLAVVSGKQVVQHILFAETVTSLKPEGGDDGSL